jgi:hypothetical protein
MGVARHAVERFLSCRCVAEGEGARAVGADHRRENARVLHQRSRIVVASCQPTIAHSSVIETHAVTVGRTVSFDASERSPYNRR